MSAAGKRLIGGTVPAAMISAPASGSGKSMITAALARLHRNAGRDVRVFKHGPDFLDPMVLEQASGNPVYQLHPWMTGEAECRWRLARAAQDADLILVEGSMGLFDGEPSSADLAMLADIPVIPVIDAWGMAQTFGAVAGGLATYRPDLRLSQVIANRVGSPGHGKMLVPAMPEGIELLGAVPRHEALSIPDRHLGIVQASELPELDASLDAAAEVLGEAGLDQLPEPVRLQSGPPEPAPRLLEGTRIAIARDAAMAFSYRANTDLLEAMGAELEFFSPLRDSRLPPADALWLPGGYPELHAATLAANRSMREAIVQHHGAGKPILAECGGLMYCLDELVDEAGQAHPMLGLLPGRSVMTGKLMGLGIQSLEMEAGTLRGHTFHHSRLETDMEATAHTRRGAWDTPGEPVFTRDGLTATYFHAYFPSSPQATAALFRK